MCIGLRCCRRGGKNQVDRENAMKQRTRLTTLHHAPASVLYHSSARALALCKRVPYESYLLVLTEHSLQHDSTFLNVVLRFPLSHPFRYFFPCLEKILNWDAWDGMHFSRNGITECIRMGMGSKTSSKASMGGTVEESERLHCVITEKDAAITALQVRCRFLIARCHKLVFIRRPM